MATHSRVLAWRIPGTEETGGLSSMGSQSQTLLKWLSSSSSSLLWFMELTFQVPMQYCSLQHQTLLPSLVTFTPGCCFALAPSLHSFWNYFSSLPIEYLAYTDWGSSSLSVLSFCLFILFHTGQNGHNKKKNLQSVLWWVWRKGNPPTLLVEM